MKTLFAFLLLCFALPLLAQTAPPLKGTMIDSGPLVVKGEVTGFYRITTPDHEAKDPAFEILLLDTLLKIRESVVFSNGEVHEIEKIAWNGTHYGLVYRSGKKKKERVRYLEFLDATGERVDRRVLERSNDARCTGLHPTETGFLVGETLWSANSSRFEMARYEPGREQPVWRYSGKNAGAGIYLTNQLLSATDGRLLFQVRSAEASQDRHFYHLYCIDARTGKVIYEREQAERSRARFTRPYLGGALVDGGAVVAQHVPGPRSEEYNYGFELRRHDAAGTMRLSHRFNDRELLRRALADNKHPAISADVRVVRTGIRINPQGATIVAYELVDVINKPGTRFNDYRYGDAYVLVIQPDFTVGPVAGVKRKGFRLTESEALGASVTELHGINRKMTKANYDKLNLSQHVTLQEGPYGTALGVAGDAASYFVFFDRVIQRGGAEYHGVEVVTYRNGKLLRDHVVVSGKPDLISVQQAPWGTLKIRSHKYGVGTEAWIQRLSSVSTR